MMCLSWKQWQLLLLGLLSLSGVLAQPVCERYELQSPKRGSQIADRQPELQWGGDPGASYRVQVAVVLPEGRVLESTDTVVTGTKWRPNGPVSVLTSVFKVIVSRNCPTLSVQDLNAQGPYFIVQSAEQCALKPRSVAQKGNILQWASVGNADKFVVQIFSVTKLDDGNVTTRRIAGYEAADTSWKLPDVIDGQMLRDSGAALSWTASVQARCGALVSQPQAIRLSTE